MYVGASTTTYLAILVLIIGSCSFRICCDDLVNFGDAIKLAISIVNVPTRIAGFSQRFGYSPIYSKLARSIFLRRVSHDILKKIIMGGALTQIL